MMKAANLFVPAMLEEPGRIVEPTSWVSHIPFAFWLVRALSPRLIVELGTHTGNSYFSLCQAVRDNQLSTACFAVDTWTGDSHAGTYGEEIFQSVADHNDAHFGAFSTLIRSTFDDALGHFRDGSVDLLHIDGFHTAEAVAHDFSSWLPKISPRGVVIMHDINVRERDFGAWRIWEELRERYPSLEFLHGHGLGVLAVGGEIAPEIRRLLDCSGDTETLAHVRKLFSRLGQSLLERHTSQNSRKQLSERVRVLEIEEKRKHAHIAELHAFIANLRTQRDENTKRIGELENAVATLSANETELADLKANLDRLRTENAALAGRLPELTEKLREAEDGFTRSRETVKALSASLVEKSRVLAESESRLRAHDHDAQRLTQLADAVAQAENLAEVQQRQLAQLAESRNQLLQRVCELDDARTAAAQRVAAYAQALAVARQDRTHFEMAVDQFEHGFRALVGSSRWRMGNRLGELKRVLSRQPKQPLATDFLETLLRDIRQWCQHPLPQPEAMTAFAAPAGVTAAAANVGSTDCTALAALETAPPVTVVVPVYNAPDDVAACLDSLIRNTTVRAQLLIIDDASPDPRIAPLLAAHAHRPNVRILRNSENLGFTGTVNRALGETTGDVVLLNSDTEVTPRWLDNLRLTAYSQADVGTVTAVSDNAGAFSFPVPGEVNTYPLCLDPDSAGRALFQGAAFFRPEVPTGNGFCLYIKRQVVDRIGLFDREAFPRGYGEENDYCLRALNAGFRHLIDESALVFHREGRSFGESRQRLMEEGAKALLARYPEYPYVVADAFGGSRLRQTRAHVSELFKTAATAGQRPRPRVLSVFPRVGGGMEHSARDIAAGLSDSYEHLLLTSDGRGLQVHCGSTGALLEECTLPETMQDCRVPNGAFAGFVSGVILRYGVELVHLHHLLHMSVSLVRVVRALSVPLVVNVHDFFMVCPTINLLDAENRHCGGDCANGQGACPVPLPAYARVPGLRGGWVASWRQRLAEVLEAAAIIAAPSASVVELHRKAFPQIAAEKWAVIPHGRDLRRVQGLTAAPSTDGPVRILIPGILVRHKGASFVQRLRELDKAGRFEFHFAGSVPAELAQTGIDHGPYQAEHFADLVRKIRPSVIGLFSICPETWSHVLTESWSCGVPVVTLDLGAQAERVRANGGGWVLPLDPDKAYKALTAILATPADHAARLDEVAAMRLPSRADMAKGYDAAFRTARTGGRAFAAPSDARPLRVGMVVQATGDDPIACAHLRLLRPLEHPAVRDDLVPMVHSAATLAAAGESDVMVVQRAPLSLEDTRHLIAMAADRKVPLVLDVDDDLTALGKDHPEHAAYGEAAKAMEELAKAANIIVASTPVLADTFGRWPDKVRVLANALDESLWFAGNHAPARTERGHVALLYAGTATHGADLALLRPALDMARQETGLDIRLSVIGGEPTGAGQDWYERVDVPLSMVSYPAFARWMRANAAAWDIGLAPLVDTPFNRAKSALKYLEYSALGLAGAYAALPPYEGVVQDGVNGLLVGPSAEAWGAAVARLAKDADLRRTMANAAFADVSRSHVMRGQSLRLRDILREAVSG
ncbi:class I SAM-dependent methyltransferase [Magnetospirillum sp. 15-1]|uniref:class I SAM-dependent methyltransferase n=1 Tax=Magnetospirillum sp. 15-1 TaxID=1979370 RepID=UPI000BBCF4E1|nr:class I SAM-dependent methyltransferase [Magnetospirillum sp. 15-1]